MASATPCWPGAGFSDELFLPHKLGEQAFPHTVVQLMGAGVVQILPLEIDLALAKGAGQAGTVIDGSGAALKLPPNPAQLVDKLGAVADFLIGVVDLLKGGDQLRRQKRAAVLPKITVFIREFFQIVVKVLICFH